MAAIPANWGDGGNNLNPKESTTTRPSMALAMRDAADDLAATRNEVVKLVTDITAIRTSIVGITAQLDGDAGVTDTTYASGNDPAAITATNPAALKTTKV